jgi:hypothetical protein
LCIPDTVPRRDAGLTDQQRDEMDEWRCEMLLFIVRRTRRHPEKLEELISTWRYIAEGHEELPDSLKSKKLQ